SSSNSSLQKESESSNETISLSLDDVSTSIAGVLLGLLIIFFFASLRRASSSKRTLTGELVRIRDSPFFHNRPSVFRGLHLGNGNNISGNNISRL
ncbi:hypothetical protein C0J52_15678, partial [Blattella germanica]